MISIIVPVLNEEKNIKKIQDNLKRLDGEFEVIFCDGGSTDKTVEYIESGNRIISARKGRGYQMNAGASIANGDVLFFLHCDAELEKDVLLKIPEDVKRGDSVGYLNIQFDSEKILMKICAFMSDARTRFRKIVYGDQGVIINKDLFYELNMFPEFPIMEDLEFSIKLKKEKIPLMKIASCIKTSARRFEKNGMLRTMWQMQCLQVRFLLGETVEKIVEEYENIR